MFSQREGIREIYLYSQHILQTKGGMNLNKGPFGGPFGGHFGKSEFDGDSCPPVTFEVPY